MSVCVSVCPSVCVCVFVCLCAYIDVCVFCKCQIVKEYVCSVSLSVLAVPTKTLAQRKHTTIINIPDLGIENRFAEVEYILVECTRICVCVRACACMCTCAFRVSVYQLTFVRLHLRFDEITESRKYQMFSIGSLTNSSRVSAFLNYIDALGKRFY